MPRKQQPATPLLHEQDGYAAFSKDGRLVPNTFASSEVAAQGRLCEEFAGLGSGQHPWFYWRGYGYVVKAIRLQAWGRDVQTH